MHGSDARSRRVTCPPRPAAQGTALHHCRAAPSAALSRGRWRRRSNGIVSRHPPSPRVARQIGPISCVASCRVTTRRCSVVHTHAVHHLTVKSLVVASFPSRSTCSVYLPLGHPLGFTTWNSV